MHARCPLFLVLAIAGSTNALADDFLWPSGTGDWENPNNWIGPIGQYPDSILDSATISGDSDEVYFNANLALAELTILGAMDLLPAGPYSVFVNGNLTIDGIGTRLVVVDSPALRDLDADIVTVTSGVIELAGGLAQIDEELRLNPGGIWGSGVIEMNSTTGDLVFDGGGSIRTDGPAHWGNAITLRRTDSSTARLDWTAPGTAVIARIGKSIINELPYRGPLGGTLIVNADGDAARFVSANGFVAGPGSRIWLAGLAVQWTAGIEAPAFDSYGEISASGLCVIDAPFTALRGTLELEENTLLNTTASSLILDSLGVTSTGPGTVLRLGGPGGTVNVVGGTTTIALGADGEVDLDGTGTKTINIDEDSTLSLAVESIDDGNAPSYDGTFNISGALDVDMVGGTSRWQNGGEIVLDGGVITGSRIDNVGVIRGRGQIDTYVSNIGEIIAEGGTLEISTGIADGHGLPATGVIRAQDGDLIMNGQAGGAPRYFTGSAIVGNGNRLREVLEMDVDLVVGEQGGVRGSIVLDSGFVVLHDFTQGGELTVNGVSQIRTTGTDDAHKISFSNFGDNAIHGVLQVDGRTWFAPDTLFAGQGTINAVSTIKGTYFLDGSDLGDVGFASSGPVFSAHLLPTGRATMGSITLADTAAMNVSMGDVGAPITSDRFIARGAATLGGRLVLSWNGQGEAPLGATATILEAASVQGQFDVIDDSGLGVNRRAHVTIDADSVEVFITCSADLNADGQTDFFDVSAFLAAFNASVEPGDWNDDGEFDFFDVSAYLASFDAGC